MAVKDDDKKIAAAKKRKSAGMKAKADKAAAAKAKMNKDVKASQAKKAAFDNAKKIYAGPGTTLAKEGTPVREKQMKEQNRRRAEGTANEINRSQGIDRIKKEEGNTFRSGGRALGVIQKNGLNR
jgi:hypothetical protein